MNKRDFLSWPLIVLVVGIGLFVGNRNENRPDKNKNIETSLPQVVQQKVEGSRPVSTKDDTEKSRIEADD